MDALSQGVQRERLAHVSCLQGVVGYTASDADRLSNILLVGGGVCSESVFPQWLLRGKRVLPRGLQHPVQCIFYSLGLQFVNGCSAKTTQKRGVSVLLRCCQQKKGERNNGKFCDTQDRKTEAWERDSDQ